MITCQVELLRNCLVEMTELFPMHWEMLALNQDKVPLQPQYASYLRDEAEGRCSCIVMRSEGKIVGYWVHYIAPGKHYETCLTSIMDIFFIRPEFRSGANAIRLMRAVEGECRRRGVQRWFASEKLHSPVGRLFRAMGFTPVEQTWAKWLGD